MLMKTRILMLLSFVAFFFAAANAQTLVKGRWLYDGLGWKLLNSGTKQ